MADMMALAAQLRATRQAEQDKRTQMSQQGGAATTPGGTVGSGMFQTGGYAPQQNNGQQSQQNPLQTGLDAYNKYRDVSKLTSGGASGAFAGATPATMSAMSAGGGSSLGSMGLMSSAPAVSFPGAASASAGAGSGATAGGAAAGGGAMAAGGLGALGALAYLGDKEMNESKNSPINAEKLNKMGSVNGIGFRGGDLVNGFNPGTWLSDPKKAAKGLGNFFTLGFLDKII